jgi:ribosomal protein S18 acetylase RimI-like enzyme
MVEKADNNLYLLAIAGLWIAEDQHQHQSAILEELVANFGLVASAKILERNQQLAQLLPPPLNKQAVLCHFCVKPQCRRNGYAKKMITFCADVARRRSQSQLIVDVDNTNHAALALYQNAGFAVLCQPDISAFDQYGLNPHTRLFLDLH